MNATSFISHRMFVAAVSHDVGVPARTKRPGRPANEGTQATPGQVQPEAYNAEATAAALARQLLSPSAANGF